MCPIVNALSCPHFWKISFCRYKILGYNDILSILWIYCPIFSWLPFPSVWKWTIGHIVTSFKVFSFPLMFYYNVSMCGFLSIYPAWIHWASWIGVSESSQQSRKMPSISVSNIHSVSFPLAPPSGSPIRHVFVLFPP